jgi:hypothetical protein
MSETAADLAAQLKAFYETGHEYANHISPTTLTHIERLCGELDRPPSPALQQRGTRSESATPAQQQLFPDTWVHTRATFRAALRRFERLVNIDPTPSEPGSSSFRPRSQSRASGSSAFTPSITGMSGNGQGSGSGSGQGQNQNNGDPNANAHPMMNRQDHIAIANILFQLNQDQQQNQNQNQSVAAAQPQPYSLRTEEVGVFDPNPQDAEVTGSGITSVGKLTVYTNIYAFTNRLRELASKKGDKAVQDNWTTWLRGEAIAWHTHELSDLERELLTNVSLDGLLNALIKRFKELASSAMKNIGSMKFGISNL